jgi:hypothetical protein
LWSKPRKTLQLRAGEAVMLQFSVSDFQEKGSCCHCPFASVFDFEAGRDSAAFEVLGGRDARAKRGTDRYRLSVPVRQHRAVVHVRELEPEVTFLEGLALESDDGRLVPPSTAARAVLRMGDEATFRFRIDDIEDGEATMTLVVDGYYLPLD